MVKKKDRLPIGEFFLKKGKSILRKGPHLSLRAKMNECGYCRIGVTIKTSVEKKSTMRNYWKRRIHFVAHRGVNKKEGIDMLFTLDTHAEKRDRAIVLREAQELIKSVSFTR